MNYYEFMQTMQQYEKGIGDWSAVAGAVQALATGGKTPLGLNQWVLTDKPRMEEFNEDNRIIDAKLREHEAPPAVHSLEFRDSFVNADSYKSIYTKTRESLVVVDLYVRKADGNIPKNANIVAQLPPGFRPAARRHTTCFTEYAFSVARLYVDPNGYVVASAPQECGIILGQITFVAAQ